MGKGPSLPSPPSGSVGHAPSTGSPEQRWGWVLNAGCLAGFKLWGQDRIHWSSRIPGSTHHRLMRWEQKGTCLPRPCNLRASWRRLSQASTGGAHTGLRLPFAPSRWAWVASSPSLLLLFMRPTPLSQVSPPPQLLNVGKYRSFLLPHFRVVGEREGKGRRNVPISICIETASLSS